MVETNTTSTDGQTVETDAPETTETTPAEETQEVSGEDSGTLLGKASAEEKEGDGKETPEVQYDFKLPEGMSLDKGLADAITPIFKEAGIGKEVAQKIVDSYIKHLGTTQSNSQQEAINTWEKQVSEWKAEAQKDLGSTAKQDLSTAAKFMDRYGSPRLREILDETGFGNHPELIKLFVRAGKSISEDSFVDGGQHASSSQGVDLKKLYPTMKE